MKATIHALLVLGLTGGGCATPSDAPPRQSTMEAQVVDLQQERQQLLTTLGEFHDRIRDLESKLADREGRPAAQSYAPLLAIKEAELNELRKTTAESKKLSAQLDTTASDLNQAKLRVSALEQQVTKKDQGLGALKGLATAAVELESAKHRMADLESLLSQRDQEIHSLRISAAERESLAAQLQTARQRMASFEQHATEREQELNVVRKGVGDRDRLVNQLAVANMELAQTKQKASNLERQLAAKTQELNVMKNAMASKER